MTGPPSKPVDPAVAGVSADTPPPLQQGEGDMVDTAEEIAFWTPLPLAECAPINAAFVSIDREALNNQRWHRRFTLTAMLCGGGAVLISVWNIGYGGGPNPQLAAAEFTLVVLLGMSIAIGLGQQRKNRWLLNRHKAELLRLLKFEFVSTPSVWAARERSGASWVGDKLRGIEGMRDRRSLEEAVSTGRIAEEIPLPPDISSSTLLKLVEYYLGKRLNPQKEYLANRAQRNAFWTGVLRPNITTAMYFVSVTTIASQAVFVLVRASENIPWIIWSTVGAASLPVFASMARTVRSAFEFSRNRSRFLAAHDALSKLEQRLTHHLLWARTADLTPEAKAVIPREFERCETQLRTEHNEWLRLMLEAEWFG